MTETWPGWPFDLKIEMEKRPAFPFFDQTVAATKKSD